MSAPELYHNPLSTCSQKVRLALVEKGVPFVSREINLMTGEQHDPAYVKLNPNHVVPTLVHDGHVLLESTLINEYVDEAFAGPALRPDSALGRHAIRLWTKRIDEKVHTAAPVVTFAIGPRNLIRAQPPEVREAAIAKMPDPRQREERRSVIEHGVKAPEFARALGEFLRLFDDMDDALASAPWLSGERFGLADAAAVPYVLRLEHLAMVPFIAARPRLADWLARIKARPSWDEAVAKWAPPAVLAMLREQGQAVWADVEPLATRS